MNDTRPRLGKTHSTARAWKVTAKNTRRFRAEEHELFQGLDGKQIYADVYRVCSSESPEERLNADSYAKGYRSDVSVASFEYDHLPLTLFRMKRMELRRKINELRSRSRKKKYADNPVPILQQTPSKEERVLFCDRLAHPGFALSSLAASVPFGYKSDVLLDMLWSKHIPIQRASWFIKIVYLNLSTDKSKVRGGRRLPAERKLKCREEWTEQLQQYLIKQIQTINPSLGKSGSIEHIQKWNMLSRLLFWQYSRGLINRVKFLHWLVVQLDESASNELALSSSLFWLPVVALFLPEIQMSRLHSHRLWISAIKLISTTAAGRAANNELKSLVYDAAEAIVHYLNEAIPLSRAWGGPQAIMQKPAVFSCSIPLNGVNLNVPSLLLLLDTTVLHKTGHSPDLQSIIAPVEEQDFLSCVLQWSLVSNRPAPYRRIQIALRIVSLLLENSNRISVQSGLVKFLFSCRPASAYEYGQLCALYDDLSRNLYFSSEQSLRYIESRGLLSFGSADPRTSDTVRHARWVLESVPIYAASSQILRRRSHALYGRFSQYDQHLRSCILYAVFNHFESLSGGLFYESLRQINPDIARQFDDTKCIAELSEMKDWNHFVNINTPSDTNLLSICQRCPRFHIAPALDMCMEAVLFMYTRAADTTDTCNFILQFERVFQSISVCCSHIAYSSGQAKFIVDTLQKVPVLECRALLELRGFYHVIKSIYSIDSIRSACSHAMMRSIKSVQGAEIWLANARLPSEITRWLSDNAVKKFSGRYQQQMATDSFKITQDLRASLEQLFCGISEASWINQVERVLATVAVDSQSIGDIISFVMESAAQMCFRDSSVIQSDHVHDCLSKHALALRLIVNASDRLGDNRVSCHDMFVSHYIDRLQSVTIIAISSSSSHSTPDDTLHNCFANEEFLQWSKSLVNQGIFHLDILIQRAIIRPIKLAASTRAHPEGLRIACQLSSCLFGSIPPSKASFCTIDHFELMYKLYGESFSVIFPIIPCLAQVALHSDSNLQDSVVECQTALNCILSNPLFCRFCLASLPEVCSQLSGLKYSRWIFHLLCLSDNQVAFEDYQTIHENLSPSSLLLNVNFWTVHLAWIDIRLALIDFKKANPDGDAEVEVANLLLRSTGHIHAAEGSSTISSELAVELMKLLGSVIGRHTLFGIQTSLKLNNQIFWKSICDLTSLSPLDQHRSTAVNQLVGLSSSWKTVIVVRAMASALSPNEYVNFISILIEDLERLVEYQSMNNMTDNLVVTSALQCHVMHSIRCLRCLTLIIQGERGKIRLYELLRALVHIMGCQAILESGGLSMFASVLDLFEVIVDGIRFTETSTTTSAGATALQSLQRKDDDFLIELDREAAKLSIPLKLRHQIQRTLPTFSGGINQHCQNTSLFENVVPAQVFTPGGATPLTPSSVTVTNAPSSSATAGVSLDGIDPWTILQGVPGTQVVQRLLESSSIVARDGSTVDFDAEMQTVT